MPGSPYLGTKMSYMLLLVAWLSAGGPQAMAGPFYPSEEACKTAADDVIQNLEAHKDSADEEGIRAVRVMCVPVSNPETEQKS